MISLLALLGTATAEEPSSMVIINIDTRGIVDGSSLSSVQSRLYSLLASHQNLHMQPINAAEPYFTKNRITLPSLCKDECKVDLGTSLSAKFIVVPTLVKENNGLLITLDLFNVESKKVVATSQAYANGEISVALSEAVEGLLSDAPNLGSSNTAGMSDMTKTLLEAGGSVTAIGLLVLFGSASNNQTVAPVNKSWTDNITLK